MEILLSLLNYEYTEKILYCISALAPVILTIITIFITIRSDKRNRELQCLLQNRQMEFQNNLHNRDVVNQTRIIILDIYGSFFKALDFAMMSDGEVEEIFVSEESYTKWFNELNNKHQILLSAYYKAEALFSEDSELVRYLFQCLEAFTHIKNFSYSFIKSGMPLHNLSVAWEKIANKYGIATGDYFSLRKRYLLYETFKLTCRDSSTIQLQKNIHSFIELVKDEKMSRLFRKYIRIRIDEFS